MLRINIKGFPGEGKTTLAHLLGNFLTGLGHEVIYEDDSGLEHTAPFKTVNLNIPAAIRIREKSGKGKKHKR